VSIDLEMVDQVYKRTYNSCPVRQHICSYKNWYVTTTKWPAPICHLRQR